MTQQDDMSPQQRPNDPTSDRQPDAEPARVDRGIVDDGAANRGQPARVKDNGEVFGSGASAGGKGGPEDFDEDPQAGGGAFMIKHPDDGPDEGGDASPHNSA